MWGYLSSKEFDVFLDEIIEGIYEILDDLEEFALEGNLLMVKSKSNEAIQLIKKMEEYISKSIMIGEK